MTPTLTSGASLGVAALRAGRKTSELVVTVLVLLFAAAAVAAGLLGWGHPPAVARDAAPGVGLLTGGGVAAFYVVGRSGLKRAAVGAASWLTGHPGAVAADAETALRYLQTLIAEARGVAAPGAAASVLASVAPVPTPPAAAATLEAELQGLLARRGASFADLGAAVVRLGGHGVGVEPGPGIPSGGVPAAGTPTAAPSPIPEQGGGPTAGG